jgi:hypothetical protein
MTRRREPLANRWLWSGIVAGPLVSFLLLPFVVVAQQISDLRC